MLEVEFIVCCENCNKTQVLDDSSVTPYANDTYGVVDNYIDDVDGWLKSNDYYHFCSEQCYKEAMEGV